MDPTHFFLHIFFSFFLFFYFRKDIFSECLNPSLFRPPIDLYTRFKLLVSYNNDIYVGRRQDFKSSTYSIYCSIMVMVLN
jgi:hypothetical protein